MNFKTAVDNYVQHLTDIAQKPSTIGTARRSLVLVLDAFGPDSDITSVDGPTMETFINDHPVIHCQPDGSQRALASRLQIQRIIRSACTHWHGVDYLARPAAPRAATQRNGRSRQPAATNQPETTTAINDQPEAEEAHVEPLAQPEPPAVEDTPLPLATNEPDPEPLPTVETTALDEQQQLAEATQEPAPAPTPVANEYVYCHKTHKRRPVAVCQQRGCLSRQAAARCSHWQAWLTAGLVE